MRTLLDEMKVGLGDLGTQTGTLVKALRQPQTRGEWGEVQLKRCVEIAGMTEHVDFELQKTLHGEDGAPAPRRGGDAAGRPPCRDRLQGAARRLPRGARGRGRPTRKGELIRHARQVRDHITKLSSKRYQDQFESGDTPDFVVCFMPSEAALHAAFEAEPSLYDYALEQKILIATPTTLVGLLRTVELGWRQERIAEQAQEIASAARELHSRMGAFLEHFSKAGRQLDSADQILQRRGRLAGEPDHAAASPHRGDGRRLRQGAGGAAAGSTSAVGRGRELRAEATPIPRTVVELPAAGPTA